MGLPRLEIHGPPPDDDSLWEFVATVWGIKIPRTRVCPGHQSPFDAFADAYFARHPVSVWKASRGFGGKSKLLSALACTEVVALGCEAGVLGGSGEQSERVIAHMGSAWNAPYAPIHLLASEPGHTRIRLTNGATAWAQMASQKSVRGAHPPRLRVDEVDELDLPILWAALGQPMSQKGVVAQTVLSSTHQYPDKGMTWALNEAKEKSWGIFEWCWRETVEPHGWLPMAEVERKRQELPRHVFAVEIDLQEPAAEGRAILPEAVEAMFSGPEIDAPDGKYLEFEPPDGNGTFAHGCDWAKQKDWTVIVTLRTDVKPARVAAFERVQRLPWPVMVPKLDQRIARYGGPSCHDNTGLGGVVSDYLRFDSYRFDMVGRDRAELFSEYVAAIERNEIRSPRIDFMYREHKFATRDDLYKAGTQNHPPDSVVAGAMAYYAWQKCLAGELSFGNLLSEPRERTDWGKAEVA